MSHAGLLQPGQRLVIPRLAAAPQISAPQTRVAGPAVAPAAANNGHTVAPGETIYSLARHYRLTPMAIAKANNLTLAQQLRVGQRIVIPGGSAPRLAMPAQPAPAPVPQQHAAVKPESLPAVKQPAQPKVAQVEPGERAGGDPAADPLPGKRRRPARQARAPASAGRCAAASSRASARRRPAARMTGSRFGAGRHPDCAAEEGVAAYAGNELKGYGNLVLVRHANGFVTAYAHASELGEEGRDGQARSGDRQAPARPAMSPARNSIL